MRQETPQVPHPLRVVLLGVLLLAVGFAPTPSSAAELAGEYEVHGHEMGDGRYNGKAAVTKSGDTYAVVWMFGPDIHRGTGILLGDTFSIVFYVRQSPVPGLAVYHVEEDGTLTGQFTVLGGKKVGAEMWKPIDH
jgi:hypothetical protein